MAGGGGGKIDLKKVLDASLKQTRSSVFQQRKDYGENYKSKYSHTVDPTRKQSAPVTSLRKSKQQRRTVDGQAARMSEYSRYSLQQKKKPKQSSDASRVSKQKSDEFGGFFMRRTTKKVNHKPKGNPAAANEVERSAKIRFSIADSTEGESSDQKAHRHSVASADNNGLGSFSSAQIHTRDWHYHRTTGPRRSITFRDGSIDIRIDMADMLAEEVKKDDNWDWDDDDEDASSLHKGTDMVTEDSILSLRQEKFHREETLEEYNRSWKHFFEFFAIELVVATILIILTFLFVFTYNYGFTTSNSLNITVDEHDRGRVLLNAHMLIMIIPNSILMGIGVLTYRTFRTISRTQMKWLHGSMGLVASISFTVGLYFCIVYHRIAHTPDLNSLHNWLGVFCCFLQLLQMATGFVYVLPFFSWDTRVSLSPTHKTFGGVLMIAHGAAILTGCVNMTNKYYDTKNFPQYYPYPLWVVQKKSAAMNLIGIFTLFFVTNTLYIQGNFHFRRRIQPGLEAAQKRDPDIDAMTIVNMRKKSVALANETLRPGGAEDDAQVGSRQSFNLKHLTLPNYGYNNTERTIPMMLNGLQQHRSNFNDDYFFLTLE